MKYTPDNPPPLAEVEAIHKYMVRMVGEAQSRAWEDLYWDYAAVSRDYLAAIRGEVAL